ncbi:MAG TPA: NAD(P)-dependent oxidoreductase [Acidimicrobiales bacterium]|nr:NAD(P)-dependent oxidoreductase [Acidimicrobiales bacterium]
MDARPSMGIVVSCDQHAGTPSYAAAELTWALVLAAMRQLPEQVRSLRAGHWQAGVGRSRRSKTLGSYGYGRIGAVVAGYGRAFGLDVMAWSRPESLERARANGPTPARDKGRAPRGL